MLFAEPAPVRQDNRHDWQHSLFYDYAFKMYPACLHACIKCSKHHTPCGINRPWMAITLFCNAFLSGARSTEHMPYLGYGHHTGNPPANRSTHHSGGAPSTKLSPCKLITLHPAATVGSMQQQTITRQLAVCPPARSRPNTTGSHISGHTLH